MELYKKRIISSKLILTGCKSFVSDEFTSIVEEGRKMNVIEERGYITDELLSELYSNARALIYPSKYEGFGMPPLEAMNCGCPVITTKYTSIPEVCGDAALYIDPQDPISFGNAIIELEKNDQLYNILIEKSRKRAKCFSWENAARVFLGEIERYAEGKA